MPHEASPATTTGIISREVGRDFGAVLGFSLALAIARHVIHTPIGVPGHSAVFWIPVLVLAGFYRMPGTVVACATCGSLLGIGLGDLDALKIAGVLAAASVIEAFGLGQRQRPGALLILVAATLSHLGKLSTKLLAVVAAGLPLNRVGLPLGTTLALYAAFGLIGGVLAFAVLSAWRAARSTLQSDAE